MVKEWSVWLLTLQGGACTVLWQPLKQQSVEHSLGSVLLLLGWLSFGLSIITATVLLGLMPGVVESLTDEDSRLYKKQVSTYPLFRNITIGHFMFVEHALLIVGILLIFVFVITRQMKVSSPPVRVDTRQLQRPDDKQIKPMAEDKRSPSNPFPKRADIAKGDPRKHENTGKLLPNITQPQSALKSSQPPDRDGLEPSRHLPAMTYEQGRELFKDYIRPLFQHNCMGCHNAESKRSGLDLSTRESILRGGRLGPAIAPGDANSSLLYKRVTHEQTPGMPFRLDKLPQESIDRIFQWINSCAPFEKPVYPASTVELTGLFHAFADGYLLFVLEKDMPFTKTPKKILHDYERDFSNPPPYDKAVEVRIMLPEDFLFSGLPTSGPHQYLVNQAMDRTIAKPKVAIIGHWIEVTSRESCGSEPGLLAEQIMIQAKSK